MQNLQNFRDHRQRQAVERGDLPRRDDLAAIARQIDRREKSVVRQFGEFEHSGSRRRETVPHWYGLFNSPLGNFLPPSTVRLVLKRRRDAHARRTTLQCINNPHLGGSFMLLRRYSILAVLAALLVAAAVPLAAVCREENFIRVPQSIQTFASDDTYVYFGTLTGKLQRANKATKAITTVATIGGKIEEMTLDGTTIFFSAPVLQADSSTKTFLYSVPKAGGAPTQLAELNDLVGNMRVDAATLYWVIRSKGFSDATGKIQKMSKSGGTVSTLAQNLAVPVDLYVSSDAVYFTEDGLNRTPPYGLSRVGLNGGTVQRLSGARA